MDNGDWDFVNSLHPDVVCKILTCVDDPSDIVRASSVSRAWHDFITENGICKLSCMRLFPQLSGIAHIVDLSTMRQLNCSEAEQLKKEHRVFSALAQQLSSSEVEECIAHALLATSTDRYPDESVINTLKPQDLLGNDTSYWSSSGTNDPEVPEMLTYELISDFCVITEINVQPFQAFFQANYPIYSAKAVRFRTGYRVYDNKVDNFWTWPSSDEHFLWTYTSEEFPMAQENRLQNFKLPKPILCIGGLVQIELLGRVQRQQTDGKFYICVNHVQVLGRSLDPDFDVDTLEPTGRFSLLFDPLGPSEQQGSSPITGEVQYGQYLLSKEKKGKMVLSHYS